MLQGLELRRYLSVLRKRLLLILVTVAVAVVVAVARTPDDRLYVANATLLVGPQQFEPSVSNDVLSAVERITTTFSQLIPTQPVAAAALEDLGLGRSAASVAAATSASVVPETQLLVVTVADPDPAVARDLANAMSDAFVDRVGELDPGEGAIPFAPVYVFERAQLPTTPVATSALQQVVIAGLFGLVAAVGVSFLLEYLDITIKSAAAVERRLQLPVLGVVPKERLADEPDDRRLATLERESA